MPWNLLVWSDLPLRSELKSFGLGWSFLVSRSGRDSHVLKCFDVFSRLGKAWEGLRGLGRIALRCDASGLMWCREMFCADLT